VYYAAYSAATLAFSLALAAASDTPFSSAFSLIFILALYSFEDIPASSAFYLAALAPQLKYDIPV
jgi:hypothetical protein